MIIRALVLVLVCLAMFRVSGAAAVAHDATPVPEVIQSLFGGNEAYDIAWLRAATTGPVEDPEVIADRLTNDAQRNLDWRLVAVEMEHELRPLPFRRQAGPWIRGARHRSKVYEVLAERAAAGDAKAARAYVCFAGADLRAVPRQKWAERLSDAPFRAHLVLARDQDRRVASIADRLVEKSGSYPLQGAKLVDEVNALIADDSKDAAAYERFVQRFEDIWREQNGNPSTQDLLAPLYWRVACLAVHEKRAETIEKFRSRADTMAMGTADAIAAGWLREAAKGDGPRPSDAGARVIRHPDDGKGEPR